MFSKENKDLELFKLMVMRSIKIYLYLVLKSWKINLIKGWDKLVT